MKSSIQSILNVGSDSIAIEVECHVSNSLPAIVIVGLGNKAVGEAKERIRSAFASCKLSLPRKRITINLAPADVPKDSTSLDLAIAAAILQASSPAMSFSSDQVFIGEIGLNGTIRPVRGIIGLLLAGQKMGIANYFIPKANLQQAQLVPGLRLMPIETLDELARPRASASPMPTARTHLPAGPAFPYSTDTFSMIAGQAPAKRALEIAAAGGHNILLHGPPGTGKSLLAKAFMSIMPPPSHQEILEITHLQSLASHTYDDLITTRPFRSPHSSASFSAMIGGGNGLRPGEIVLSHQGVLFLDELPEFSRTILEALRQPLEDGCITISRARRITRYPTRFILVGTANPCPCGYYGSLHECSCTSTQVARYQQKLSGPILDRIDLHVTVDQVEHREILYTQAQPAKDQAARDNVLAARRLQRRRFDSEKTNSQLTQAEIMPLARPTEAAVSLLTTAAERLDISARSYVKLIKVARTIADLENEPRITEAHISEALQYRQSRQKS